MTSSHSERNGTDPMISPSWIVSIKEGKGLNVVVIGGSLAGLMHGIMLKRLGHHVHLIEQNLSSTRTDHAAGIGTGPQGTQFLKEHDLYPDRYSFSCPGFNFLDKNSNVKRLLNLPLNVTSWNVLYYRLQANFDGLRSEYCPALIDAPASDGKAIYDPGKRATNISSTDQLATVEFDDLQAGGSQTIHADLVIVADEQNSIIRGKFMPDRAEQPYSGYVVWRGTVPEKDVSETTRKLFQERFNVFAMSGGYIEGYAIPGENGTLEQGQRFINYVWYDSCPAGSKDLKENLTEIDGHTHRNTLPMGKMAPEIWQKQKDHAAQVMTPCFLELVNKTTLPFVSTIRDRSSTRASFLGGKVLFVGEALTLMRPHTGMSFNHSAVNCVALQKVLRGELTLRDWEIANGGFVVSIVHRAIQVHFQTELSKYNQPNTITIHAEFLRPTLAGETILEVRNVRLGKNSSTIHVSVLQGGQEKVAAYATNINYQENQGVSYPTEYKLSPQPCPADVASLAAGQDPRWISFSNPYISKSVTKAGSHLKFHLPTSGSPHPSITDEWITPIRAGERFTDDTLAFVADQWPHMCENYRPGSPYSAEGIIEQTRKDRVNSGAQPPDPSKWQTPFYYPTLQIGLEFKKPLPPTGVEWLFVRARARKIENGRFDAEITVLDEQGDIVALGNHVAFIVANERFSGPSENKFSSKI